MSYASIKTLVLGRLPSLKEELYQRKVREIQSVHSLSPTFDNVGSLITSAFVVLPSEHTLLP
jgi:hypothetical protein